MGARGYRWAIVLLTVAYGVVVGSVIHRAVVPAQDAVRFVSMAQSIDREGWRETLSIEPGQPLYPLLVAAAYRGAGRWIAPPEAAWRVSAQLVAAISLVVAIGAMYLLNRRLFGARVALAAAALFATFSEVSRLSADGISDGTHLAFFALALWGAIECFDLRQRGDATTLHGLAWSLFAGVSLGLATMVRAEAWVLFAAMVVAAIAWQFVPAWRSRWAGVAAHCGVLALGVALVVGPYVASLGVTRPGTIASILVGAGRPGPWNTLNRVAPSGWEASSSSAAPMALDEWALAPKETTVSSRFADGWDLLEEVGGELFALFGSGLGVLAAAGMWWRRRQPWERPTSFLAIFCGLYLVAAVAYGHQVGYLSTRHLLPLLTVVVGWSGVGGLELGRRFARSLPPAGNGALRLAPVVAVVVVSLVSTLKPVHENRIGHRRAADWLAARGSQAGSVLDSRGWTGFYSGRVTYRTDAAAAALADPQLAYIVVERHELGYDSPRGRALERLVASAATPVARFEQPSPGPDKTVVVYEWSPERWLAARIVRGQN